MDLKTMAQNTEPYTEIERENVDDLPPSQPEVFPVRTHYPWNVIWHRAIPLLFLHLGTFHSWYLIFTSTKILTTIWAYILLIACEVGVTAGAHRLWTHRSYKAKWPLRLLLAFWQTMAYEDELLYWCVNHRVHHKYSETDADPHNSSRGFFFCHIGWILIKELPEVTAKRKQIDDRDLVADPIVRWQAKFYPPLVVLCCFVMPTLVPWYFWGESLWDAFFVAVVLRWMLCLNATWLVNSAAHMWGNRPFDRHIVSAENLLVSVLASGEGWHNYHHTFPWDYKAAELGNYRYNITTAFINFMAYIGWAYDLKIVSQNMIEHRVKRTGDGSHEVWGNVNKKFE